MSSLFALTLVGYPLVALLASALNLSRDATSVPFRVFVILLSIWTIAHFAASRYRYRLDFALLAFWSLYAFRLFWDINFGRFDGAETALTFFLATAALPGLAIMLAAHGYHERLAAQLLFVLGAIVSAGSLALSFLHIGGAALKTEVTGRLALESLNAITLGHVAVTTIVAAIVLWQSPNQTGRKSVFRILSGRQIALLTGAGLALFCLIITASRGPAVALALTLASYAVLQGRWGQIVAAVLAGLALLPTVLSFRGVGIIDRFIGVSTDRSAMERLVLQGRALDQGLAHPVFGSAYVEASSGKYPHNLIIESFMALGLVGLLLFAFICARGGLTAARRLRSRDTLIPLLMVQYFVAGMFSGTFWGTGALFAILALLAVQSPLTSRAPTTSTRSRPAR